MDENGNQTPQQPQAYQSDWQQPQAYQSDWQQPQAAYAQQPQGGSPVVPQYQYAPAPTSETVKLGDWVLTLFLAAIPLVGFIMMLVWSFGSSTVESKKNWARAILIWYVVGIVLSVIASIAFGALLAGMMNDPEIASYFRELRNYIA